MHNIKIKRISEYARLPEYAHPGDAGMDMFSAVEKTLKPGEFALIGTGIKIELPENTEAQVRPRSGLAIKNGVTVLNTPGTIDEGYRGEVGVILINHSKEDFTVTPGMKIAQMIIAPVIRAQIEEVDELSDTRRGDGGFGSTGI
ncbi:MAG: dUTP diphosphatase [Candidatus Delongbacteria bacterium]|nr:dUTP diphosphatase [Candidatus Delongbacteria bacterium]MDD4205624.1 dUTP diphosphatase [Candidatus Delongbacteria bacterium]